MNVLITGVGGFIGFHLANLLLKNGLNVVGVDNLNEYYDVSLKINRLELLKLNKSFSFHKVNISDKVAVSEVFNLHHCEYVIHLAAQAGVRYSITNPDAYVESNLIGFYNVIEACREFNVKHLIYASSSSVYGLNKKVPFSTSDSADHPVSLYAATKKSNELIAHSYSHIYGLPTTGLRFFTVYGPWGRPDMAPFIFANKIINRQVIDINNHGQMWRDFTYVDDVVESIRLLIDTIPSNNKSWTIEANGLSSSSAPYRIYNIGYGKEVNLLEFVELIESELGISAIKNFREMQVGDVYKTYCSIDDLYDAIKFRPKVSIEQGIPLFIRWFKGYYK